MGDSERIPFQVTTGGAEYDGLRLPVAVVLDNLRSAYNVGSFFRTADAVGADELVLCGITSTPEHKGVAKTALGAESTVRWGSAADALEPIGARRLRGYEIAVVETAVHAVDLFDWQPKFPVCVVFGNELEGVRPEVAAACDTFVRIPMLGMKHSLNVATACGVVLFELLRKYRDLTRGVGWRRAL